jgi:hypothetical protein
VHLYGDLLRVAWHLHHHKAKLMTALEVCILCEYGNRDGNCRGKCVCRADSLAIDILIHVENANSGKPSCPEKKHDNIQIVKPGKAFDVATPIQRDEWPAYAESLASFAISSDLGLGSLCKRIIDAADDSAAGWAVAKFLEAEYGMKVSIIEGIKWRLGIWQDERLSECGACQLCQAESDAKYPLKPTTAE